MDEQSATTSHCGDGHPVTDRDGWLGDPTGDRRGVSFQRRRASAVRSQVQRCGDQQHFLSGSPPKHLRALGGDDSARVPFSLKLPKRITHEARLVDCQQLLVSFRADALHLQDKLGPLLVQLPPSLDFSAATHEPFFATLRKIWPEAVVLEPRHPTWFDARAEAMLHAFQVGRIGADPARHPGADQPAGWGGVAYWRLHGSPRMYYSSYERATLVSLADRLASHEATEIWCVFDNTASGAAAANALELSTAL
jgi:uncharacterized protein YecE (DUF72 family)